MKLRLILSAAVVVLVAAIAVWSTRDSAVLQVESLPEDSLSNAERPLDGSEPVAQPPQLNLDPGLPGTFTVDEAAMQEALQRIRSQMLQSLNDDFEEEIEEDFESLVVPPPEAQRLQQPERNIYLLDPNSP